VLDPVVAQDLLAAVLDHHLEVAQDHQVVLDRQVAEEVQEGKKPY